ncbi:hypothetical protein FO519_002599 [Halicephalobus sp. NKZ332]|nr:hypothetical protein FO519_002599 [Halicephalobus sp. NKZ332]
MPFASGAGSSTSAGAGWLIDGNESIVLNHHYQIDDILEKGPVCTIYRATNRITSKPFIIKSIDIKKYNASGFSVEDLEKEIAICGILRHQYFMQINDVIMGKNAAHMIFEYVEGSDICFEIVKRAAAGFVFSEAVSSHYLRQLIESLDFMHELRIIHRDIRPHNILLATVENNSPLKLRGFGVAVRLPDNSDFIKLPRVGIPHFMAPEVVARDFIGTPADMWSVGVLMYLLLSGRLPFNGPLQHVYDSIIEGKYSLQGSPWNYISDDAKDLLTRLLTVDPEKRLTAAQALRHRWLSDKSIPRRQHLNETVEAIRGFNSRRKLKSKVIAAVNNPRWNKFPIQSYLSADSMPGGDACESDFGARYENEDAVITVPNDSTGVERILASLDLISVLPNPPDESLKEVLEREDFLETLLAILQANDIVIDEVFMTSQMESTDFVIRPDSGAEVSPGIAHAAVVPPGITPSPRGIPVNPEFSSSMMEEAREGSQTGTLPFTKTNGFSTRNIEFQEPLPSTSGTLGDLIGTLPRPQNLTAKDPQPLFADDDDDLTTNLVSRIRVIQFTKDTEEPMGITLKITEDGRCLVARIMHGGMIHRQATLHVGDEIREINGISVGNQSVETLQKMLRDARGHVTFKIVPSYRSAPPACEIYVRAQFDYDPIQDDLIPCPQAGVGFKTGDVIQVISKDDHNWWQARFICPFPALGNLPSATSNPTPISLGNLAMSQNVVAGLIPSPELQEWRTACLAMERAKDESHCLWFNKKKKYYTTKYLRKHSDIFDQMDLVTYEEVVRLTSFRRKTLVLLGAHGVGRRHIKNTLIHKHPHRFAYPIPHTTRPPRKDEIDGKHYFFASNDQMLTDIQNSEYLEYGTHEECMYGTKLETIRSIHKQGKIAILDVEPQALKVLRTAEYSPFVVFIAAPDLKGLQDPDGSLERLGKESEILRQAFGHLFDFVICNNDIDETIKQLELIVEKLNAIPQWVPVSWVY